MNIDWRGVRFDLRTQGRHVYADDRAALFQVVMADEYREILSRIGPGDNVIDLGANIGCFSILAARTVGPRGRVVSVEPEPGNLRQLEYNLRLNHATNVTVVPRAIFSRDGELTGFRGQGVYGAIDETGNVRVATTTFSGLESAIHLAAVDAIKCDIEGGEQYLRDDVGFKSALRTADCIAAEIHDSTSYIGLSEMFGEAGLATSRRHFESDYIDRLALSVARAPLTALSLYGFSIARVGSRLMSGWIQGSSSEDSSDASFPPCMVYATRRR